MHSSDVIERVRAKLTELGVGKHVSSVHKVPSNVEVQLCMRNSVWKLQLRAGITSVELEQELDHLAAVWRRRDPNQADLEDAITKAGKP
jgi:hypothetical protein